MTIDERLPWFPCDASKLLGALAAMRPDQKLVYMIALLRIYEVAGPCTDTLEALVLRTGLNRRRVSDALDALFKSGKLVRQGGGFMNPVAERILAERIASRQERKRAGQMGAFERAKKTDKNQTSGGTIAKAEPVAMPTDLQLDLEGQGIIKEVPREKPRGKHRLPEDWEPGSEGWRYAEQHGFSRDRAQFLFQGFRTHHIGRGNKWEIWAMAWQQWVRNEVNFKKPHAGGTGRNGKVTFSDIARGSGDGH